MILLFVIFHGFKGLIEIDSINYFWNYKEGGEKIYSKFKKFVFSQLSEFKFNIWFRVGIPLFLPITIYTLIGF